MTYLHSWILFPLVVGVLSLGAGLVVRRIAGRSLPAALVVPTGFALLMIVSVLLTWKEPTSGLAGPAVVVVGVAGLVIGRREIAVGARGWRRHVWAAVAGLLPYLAIVAPVLPTGNPGFTGFARIIDLAFQLDYTAWLQDAGQTTPPLGVSSYQDVVVRMVGVGYPGGGQAALGSFARMTGLDPIWAWQPFMGVMAGVLGVSLFVILRRAIPSPGLRALAAAVAAQPTVLYSYALEAGIKELAAAALIALVAALLASHRPGDGGLREAVPFGVALGAAFCALSIGVVPWLGILGLVVIAVELVAAQPAARPRVIVNWAFAVGLALVLTVPGIVASVRLAPVATSGGPGGLGNLAAPVPAWSTFGPWLTSDHRFPLSAAGTTAPTAVLAVIVGVLAVVGFVRAVRTRDWSVVAFALAGLIGLTYVARASAEWSDFKAYTITAPIAVTTAFAGAAALSGHGRRLVVGLLAGAVVAGGVLAGNALVYRGTTLAPYDRFADLQDINDRYAGQGPSLYPVFDEYAEYLLRDVRASGLADPAGSVTGLGRDAKPGLQFVRDPDEYVQSYLDTLGLVILRRDPTASRPPGNFRLVQTTGYHEIWRREPGPKVVAHLPLDPYNEERDTAVVCRRLRESLTRAGRGARVRLAVAQAFRQSGSELERVSPNWKQIGPDFLAKGPGTVIANVTLPVSGPYTLWLRGSIGRPVDVRIDGRRVATVRWQESYPGNYIPLGIRRLAAGSHRVQVTRGGGRSLLPGTGNEVRDANQTALVGPVAFRLAGSEPVRTVSPEQGMAVCRSDKALDWIEVVA